MAKQKSKMERYPPQEWVGNIPIREKNYISIKLDQREMKRVAKISISTGLSIAMIIAYSSCPSESEKDKKVVVQFKGKVHFIPRGLLSTKRENRGGTISTKKRKS